VTIGTTDSGATGAVYEVGLAASTANIVQVDCTNALSEMGITKGYCICWKGYDSQESHTLEPKLQVL